MKKRHQFQVQQSKTKPQSLVKNLTEADLDAVSGGEIRRLREEFQAELAALGSTELGFRFPCDGPGRGGTCQFL